MTSAARRIQRLGVIAAAVFIAVLRPASAEGHASTWDDIWRQVLSPSCFAGCHGVGASGNLRVSANTEQAWHSALLNQNPAGSAGSNGMRFVDPFKPWNSFLVNKLTGDLRQGEGVPMPQNSRGYVYTCPAAVDTIVRWIKAGAPFDGYVPEDVPQITTCDIPQPALAAPPVGADEVPIMTPSFTVARPDHEGAQTSTVTAANPAGFVTRITVAASAATEYVVVSLPDASAPLVVARGESLDLTLPDGVGIPVDANQTFEITQLIRNEFWTCSSPKSFGCNVPYVNQTTGIAYVNLTIVPAVDHAAEPFVEETGSQLLLVPPKAVGASGGAWTSTPADAATGALVGVWADRRAMRVMLQNALGQVVEEGPAVSAGYVEIAGSPAAAVTYECVHGNGQNQRPLAPTDAPLNPAGTLDTQDLDAALKYGCETQGSVPAGVPAIAGGPAADSCWNTNTEYGGRHDCLGVGTGLCKPANLVYGEGVDDGRCTLIGLRW